MCGQAFALHGLGLATGDASGCQQGRTQKRERCGIAHGIATTDQELEGAAPALEALAEFMAHPRFSAARGCRQQQHACRGLVARFVPQGFQKANLALPAETRDLLAHQGAGHLADPLFEEQARSPVCKGLELEARLDQMSGGTVDVDGPSLRTVEQASRPADGFAPRFGAARAEAHAGLGEDRFQAQGEARGLRGLVRGYAQTGEDDSRQPVGRAHGLRPVGGQQFLQGRFSRLTRPISVLLRNP